MDENDLIRVQVCYAKPGVQIVKDLRLPAGATVQEAVERSGILQEMPEIDLAIQKTGIYGKLKPLDTILREHDRVEIYRPLIADPKESRRKRADKREAKNPKAELPAPKAY